jgi:multidrug efflux pump
MLALGFSVNLLTLFGLILAIGMVVDDAIVVVENVERNMTQHHLAAKEATIRSMGEIGSSLVAVVLVMASVFVPAAFLPGTTGQLYRQFAITIVISVSLSGFVALTLTPAMCSLLLRHTPAAQRGFFAWFNRQVERVTRAFGHAVEWVIKRVVVALLLLAVFLYSIWHLFHLLPTSFVPNEDQGYAMVAIIMPQSASLDRTQAVAERVDAILAKIPGVERRSMITGYSLIDAGYKANAATFFVTFKSFDERYASIDSARSQNARAILLALYEQARHIEEAIVLPIAPPPIPGIGTTGGFEFWIQDSAAGDPSKLDELTRAFLDKARTRPELAALNSTFTAQAQQLRADVDRDKATLLGLQVQDVYSAIQAQFGSLTASQFSQFSRVWWVIVQSDAKFRQQPEDLTRLYTRNSQGKMVPLSAVVSTHWRAGPDILPHFNGFPAAKVIGNPAPGFSSGQAIAAMEAVAREVLPAGYTFAWSGLAFEEKQSGGTSALAFAFGLLIVFLVLAAQYESWTLPGAVMTAVPFGILGALLTNWARGLENDVYFQIGLLVLIGLGAKNAVLRVSAAVDFRRQGKSIMEATVLAGEQRLRPIIMTSLAFAFGCLPLAMALGAGANARHSIGTGIIGGMIGETTLAMLYVPLFFYLFDRLAERRREAMPREAADPARWRRRRTGARHEASARLRRHRAARRLPDGPRLPAPASRSPGDVPVRGEGRCRHRRHAVVEAVPGPGARSTDHRGTGAQQQHRDRRGQRRAGRGAAHTIALATVSATRLRGHRRAPALARTGVCRAAAQLPEPEHGLRGGALGKLGDRPLGPHSAPVRGGAGQPAGHRRSAARRDPVAGRFGGQQLPAIARPRRATAGRPQDAVDLRRIGQAFRTAVQVRPGVEDERRAGAVAIRVGGGADSPARIADRAEPERAGSPDRPRSGSDRPRQVGR